mmetsp:Transcript_16025/g.39504  ORF Transcript_16025/g.39504 Transcript_16025/m.39504 type:complete len:157 (+) Transcript_16025:15-485(+)
MKPLDNGCIPEPRMAHSSAILGDRLFVLGGHNPIYGAKHSFVDLWSFHFPTRRWQLHPTPGIQSLYSSTLTFVHHSPSLAPSSHGVYTLVLAGVQYQPKKSKGSKTLQGDRNGPRKMRTESIRKDHRNSSGRRSDKANNRISNENLSVFTALTVRF